MRHTFLKGLMGITLLALFISPAFAAEAKDPIVGDWLLKADFDGRPINAILMIEKDAAGSYTGQWVSFFGIGKLDNFKIEGDKISFSQTNRFRDTERTSNFTGTVKDGKLEGTMSSDNGDMAFAGSKMAVLPVIGVWEFRRERQGQEIVSTLTVSQGADGKIAADWKGGGDQESTWQISDVKYENDKLTFTRKNTNPDRPMEMTYSLTAQGDTISGTTTSQRGEREVEGKRLNADLIGKWDLTLTSDRGERKQLLYVKPDMTVMYGATDAGKLTSEAGKIGFKYDMTFGDQTFTSEFKGQVENGQLTGEMTTSRGTSQVKGTKIAAAK